MLRPGLGAVLYSAVVDSGNSSSTWGQERPGLDKSNLKFQTDSRLVNEVKNAPVILLVAKLSKSASIMYHVLGTKFKAG